MACLQCGQPLTDGYEVRRLTYEPRALSARLQEHRPFDKKPVIGYVCSRRCGEVYLAGASDRQDRLRLVVSQTTPCGTGV